MYSCLTGHQMQQPYEKGGSDTAAKTGAHSNQCREKHQPNRDQRQQELKLPQVWGHTQHKQTNIYDSIFDTTAKTSN